MSSPPTWKRIRERLELQLPVRVLCKETADFEWTEMTRLNNVTPFGCGFNLKRATEKGRVLHMTIPMPRQLRVFDHAEDQYRVWALVRYANPSLQPDQKTLIFEVGVAFIGKRPPATYDVEPWRRYDIAATSFQAMARPDEITQTPSSEQRIHTRHNIPVDVQVEVIDEKGSVTQTEQTVTENISRRGASLFTTLQIPIGRFIQLTSAHYGISLFAAVRARSTGADGIPRIHVEFIDKEWPL